MSAAGRIELLEQIADGLCSLGDLWIGSQGGYELTPTQTRQLDALRTHACQAMEMRRDGEPETSRNHTCAYVEGEDRCYKCGVLKRRY